VSVKLICILCARLCERISSVWHIRITFECKLMGVQAVEAYVQPQCSGLNVGWQRNMLMKRISYPDIEPLNADAQRNILLKRIGFAEVASSNIF
jgi:hypothetical protein